MDPKDIFSWPDGFWCFREEFDQTFLRDEAYLVLALGSKEWTACADRPLWRFGGSDGNDDS